MQDDSLISGSIADNIACFAPIVDVRKVHACAKAVVTAAHETLAGATLSAVFGHALRDAVTMRPPRQLRRDECSSLDVDPYMGNYANGRFSIRIDLADSGFLRASVFQHPTTLGGEAHLKRYLRPAVNHMFVPTLPERTVMPVLQFSHPSANGEFRYLRTGVHVFARH